jgi:hypothetical protein
MIELAGDAAETFGSSLLIWALRSIPLRPSEVSKLTGRNRTASVFFRAATMTV